MMSNQKLSAKSSVPANRPNGMLRMGLIVGVGVLILAAAALALSNRQPAYQAPVAGKPAVQVSQDRFDYGTQHYNTHDTVNASFQVKNVGDQTLYVLGAPQIEVVEGCCPPQTEISSKTLHPGEEATVTFSFMMHEGMDGAHDFRVHVRTSDPETPDKTVEVFSNWVP
jgi:hypothetical protein